MGIVDVSSTDRRDYTVEAKVYLKKFWGDEWSRAYGVIADYAEFTVAPKVATAQLLIPYGRERVFAGNEYLTGEDLHGESVSPWASDIPDEDTGYADISFPTIQDWFVKIEIPRPTQVVGNIVSWEERPQWWYGIVKEIQRNEAGKEPAGDLERGTATIGCVGLEELLMRVKYTTSYSQKWPSVAGEPDVENGLFDFSDETYYTYLNKPQVFNDPALSPDGDRPWPNCLPQTTKGKPAFGYTHTNDDQLGNGNWPTWWTYEYIVEYLLTRHRPQSNPYSTDDPDTETIEPMLFRGVPFQLTPESKESWMKYFNLFPDSKAAALRHPGAVDVREMNLWDALNTVLNRKRGFGWRIAYVGRPVNAAHLNDIRLGIPKKEDGLEVVEIEVFRVDDKDITLDTGDVIPGNWRKLDIDCGDSPSVDVKVRNSSMNRYDKVVVRGARVRCQFDAHFQSTFNPEDLDLSKIDESLLLTESWTTTTQSEFLAGASNEPNYDDLPVNDARNWSDTIRRQPRYSNVFHNFYPVFYGEIFKGVPSLLQANTHNAVASRDRAFWLAVCGGKAENIPPMGECRFLRTTLLDENGNYADVEEPFTWTNGTKLGSWDVGAMNAVRKNSPPLVFFKDPTSGRYSDFTKADTFDEMKAAIARRSWHGGVECLSDEFGLRLDGYSAQMMSTSLVGVPGGYADIVRADHDWLDIWEHDFTACLAIETNEWCEEEFTDQLWKYSGGDGTVDLVPADSRDVRQVLYVDLGDQYRLDYIKYGAKYGFTEDEILYATKETFPDAEIEYPEGSLTPRRIILRDDRPRLRQVAQQIFSWHATPRRAVTLTFGNVYHGAETGQMIEKITGGPQDINVYAPVSAVRYDFSGNQRTTLQTDWAELDATKLLEVR